jgi:hypothetical protein
MARNERFGGELCLVQYSSLEGLRTYPACVARRVRLQYSNHVGDHVGV